MTRDMVVCAESKSIAEAIAKNHVPMSYTNDPIKSDLQILTRDLGRPQKHMTYFVGEITNTSKSFPDTISELEKAIIQMSIIWGNEIGWRACSDYRTDADRAHLKQMNEIDNVDEMLYGWAEEYMLEDHKNIKKFFHDKLSQLLGAIIPYTEELKPTTSIDLKSQIQKEKTRMMEEAKAEAEKISNVAKIKANEMLEIAAKEAFQKVNDAKNEADDITRRANKAIEEKTIQFNQYVETTKQALDSASSMVINIQNMHQKAQARAQQNNSEMNLYTLLQKLVQSGLLSENGANIPNQYSRTIPNEPLTSPATQQNIDLNTLLQSLNPTQPITENTTNNPFLTNIDEILSKDTPTPIKTAETTQPPEEINETQKENKEKIQEKTETQDTIPEKQEPQQTENEEDQQKTDTQTEKTNEETTKDTKTTDAKETEDKNEEPVSENQDASEKKEENTTKPKITKETKRKAEKPANIEDKVAVDLSTIDINNINGPILKKFITIEAIHQFLENTQINGEYGWNAIDKYCAKNKLPDYENNIEALRSALKFYYLPDESPPKSYWQRFCELIEDDLKKQIEQAQNE